MNHVPSAFAHCMHSYPSYPFGQMARTISIATKIRAARGAVPRVRAYQVFLSHATSDKWIAKTICEKLEARGIRTFRDDRDIDGGEDIPHNLLAQIIRSKELVLVLTPASIESQWVMLEAGAAWGRGRRIIIIMCHVDIDPIPEMFKSKKAYSINDLDRYLGEVAARAKDYLQ